MKKIYYIKENNIIYEITTSNNQNNLSYNNISQISFKECENKLKIHYNISENDSLLILKIDYFQEGSLIPIS